MRGGGSSGGDAGLLELLVLLVVAEDRSALRAFVLVEFELEPALRTPRRPRTPRYESRQRVLRNRDLLVRGLAVLCLVEAPALRLVRDPELAEPVHHLEDHEAHREGV